MRAIRLALALGLTIGWSVAGVGPAQAGVTGACTFHLTGVDVEQIDSPSSALRLTDDDDLILSGLDPATTSESVVVITIGPVVVKSQRTAYDPPADSFTATIDLGNVALYGVGLMSVTVRTDGCAADAWLRLTGRFPLATLTGLTSAGLTIGGITGQLGSIASRRRWSRIKAALGGTATGVGAAGLGQQYGWLELTYLSAGISVVAASTLGFVLAWLLGRSHREMRRGRSVVPARKRDRAAEHTLQSPRAGGVSAAPYWCYVLAETDVLDLEDHERVVGRIRPGFWYLAKREAGQWLHVSAGDGTEGWVARDSVHRPG
ncbi:MAG TPA: hypothetical protein VK960_00655 [Acidimicrobiia bacterium]|nr:hypothetical protein [Acidimicrobiia bacterium]